MPDEKGFTLIELILVVVLISIVALAFAAVFVSSMQAYVVVDTRKDALQNARMAMERMLRELRETQTVSACSPCSPTNTMTFTTVNNTTITYAWSGVAQAPLTRNGDTLAGNVEAFTVTSFERAIVSPDTDLQPESQTEIWRIQVDLQVKVGNELVELRSEVHPRNFQL